MTDNKSVCFHSFDHADAKQAPLVASTCKHSHGSQDKHALEHRHGNHKYMTQIQTKLQPAAWFCSLLSLNLVLERTDQDRLHPTLLVTKMKFFVCSIHTSLCLHPTLFVWKMNSRNRNSSCAAFIHVPSLSASYLICVEDEFKE